jgi:hypothetical protein
MKSTTGSRRHNVRSQHLPDLILVRAPLHHAAKLASTTGRTCLAATFLFRFPFIEVDETPFYPVIPARSVHYKTAATTQATNELTPSSYILSKLFRSRTALLAPSHETLRFKFCQAYSYRPCVPFNPAVLRSQHVSSSARRYLWQH